MEHIHPATVRRFEARPGQPCEFCRELDPQFLSRRLVDQMVTANRKQTASAHLTEDGYVRHRMLEVRQLTARMPRSAA